MQADAVLAAAPSRLSFLVQNGTLPAPVDLGSNSCRLEIGRYEHGQIHRTEYIKETVRQGNGLDDARNLAAEAMQRGWDCLARISVPVPGAAAVGVPRLHAPRKCLR